MKYEQALGASHAYGERNDCTVIAAALLTDSTYEEAHLALELVGRKPRGKLYYSATRMLDAIELLGCKVVDQKQLRPGVPVSRLQNSMSGRFLLFMRGHVAAYVDGAVQDWTAGRRHRVTHVWQIERNVR